MIMSEETYNSQNNVNENINIENIATISSDTENECKSSAITDGYLEGPNLSRRRKKNKYGTLFLLVLTFVNSEES